MDTPFYHLGSDGDEPFRCVYRAPAVPLQGSCVIVQSGQAGSIDELTPENELYERLAARLAGCGIGTVRFDLPRRPDRGVSTTPAQFAARVRRLELVLDAVELRPLLRRPVLLGTSLGADAVLTALCTPSAASRRVAGIVLIGCVIEEPVRLRAAVGSVAFVYGGDDCIAYADAHGRQTPAQRPERYAPITLRRLACDPTRPHTLHICPGLGHTLAPGSSVNPAEDPAKLLAQLVFDACAAGQDGEETHQQLVETIV